MLLVSAMHLILECGDDVAIPIELGARPGQKARMLVAGCRVLLVGSLALDAL